MFVAQLVPSDVLLARILDDHDDFLLFGSEEKPACEAMSSGGALFFDAGNASFVPHRCSHIQAIGKYSSNESPSRNLLSAGSEGMSRAYRPQPLQQKQRLGHPRQRVGMAALSTARRVGSARTSIERRTLCPTPRDQLYKRSACAQRIPPRGRKVCSLCVWCCLLLHLNWVVLFPLIHPLCGGAYPPSPLLGASPQHIFYYG